MIELRSESLAMMTDLARPRILIVDDEPRNIRLLEGLLFSETYQVVFSIQDTGIGIAEADLPPIFERFYRASSAKRYDQAGTGLGLAIVREMAEALGGTIEVESQVGQGTTFTVRLPRQR